MSKYLRYSHVFLLCSLVTILALGISIALCNKIEMHLWLNGTHTEVGDFFFRYYTVVGEWVPYVIVALLLFYKAGWASFLLADVALSGMIGQGLKYAFNTDRPYLYFTKYAPNASLQFVDGVRLSEWYSFPSGHTITFFALFMTLSIILQEHLSPITPKNASTSHNSLLPTTYYLLPITFYLLPVTCYLLAILGAYSRIYLNQHFAEDIVGGIIIGIISTITLLWAVPKLENTKFWNWNLLQLKKK